MYVLITQFHVSHNSCPASYNPACVPGLPHHVPARHLYRLILLQPTATTFFVMQMRAEALEHCKGVERPPSVAWEDVAVVLTHERLPP
jgi:hypothetical protein